MLRDMKKQTGFTLIELIIVVAILGIMAAYAVPNFGGLMRSSQLKTSYNDFVGTLASARAEAINRSSTITACVSTDQINCVTGTGHNWSDGYMIFVDNNRDRVRQTTAPEEEILTYEPATGSSLNITSEDYPISISIAARGRLPSEGTFVFCDGENSNTARALNLWVTGLGRLATDSNDDGTVEAVDGAEISCASSD